MYRSYELIKKIFFLYETSIYAGESVTSGGSQSHTSCILGECPNH